MPRRDPLLWVALAGLLAVDALHWARIESPAMGLLGLGVLAVLGALPTAVSAWRGPVLAWLAALPVAALAAIGQVTGIWPWHSHGHYPSAITSAISKGAHGWFSVHTPFDPAHAGAVDHDVRLVYFVLAVGLSWLLVARRWTVAAIAVAFFGFAMPSTVASIPAGGLRAAIFLGLALFCLRVQARPAAGEEGAGSGQAVAVGMAMVATAFVVAALPGVTKPAFLDWHSWNPLAKTQPQLSVSYVWNQSYKPLHWPKQQTTVFFVWSTQPHYWPVARLETFRDGSWRDTARPANGPSTPVSTLSVPPGQLPSRATVDPRAKDLATIQVQVAALLDHHLVGVGQPVMWLPPAGIKTAVYDRQQRRGQHRPGPGDEVRHARLRGHADLQAAGESGDALPTGDRQRSDDRKPALRAVPIGRAREAEGHSLAGAGLQPGMATLGRVERPERVGCGGSG